MGERFLVCQKTEIRCEHWNFRHLHTHELHGFRDEIKHEVLGLFLSDTYHSLRNGVEAREGIVYQYENTELMMVAEPSAYYGNREEK